MKRRNFFKNTILANTFLSLEVLAQDKSHDASYIESNHNVDPCFYVETENQGRVTYYDENTEEQEVLHYKPLVFHEDSLEYDEKSALVFLPSYDGRKKVGLLVTPRSEYHAAKPSEDLSDSHAIELDPFQISRFGFLLWDPVLKQLKPSATLTKKSDIICGDGNFVKEPNWSCCRVVGLLTPQNSPFAFLFVLHNFKNSTLIFLGWNTKDSCWMEIYHDNPFQNDFEIPLLSQISFLPHSTHSQVYPHLQIKISGQGVFLFDMDFLSPTDMELVPVGSVVHGSTLHQNWTLNLEYALDYFQAKNRGWSSDSKSPLCDREIMTWQWKPGNWTTVYLSRDQKLKSIQWLRGYHGNFWPCVQHSSSFCIDKSFRLFRLTTDTATQEMLLGFDDSDGFFLIDSQKDDEEETASFVKKALPEINQHPKLQEILSQQTGQQTFPQDVHLVSEPEMPDATNSSPTTQNSEHFYHLSFFQTTSPINDQKGSQHLASFQISSLGNVTEISPVHSQNHKKNPSIKGGQREVAPEKKDIDGSKLSGTPYGIIFLVFAPLLLFALKVWKEKSDSSKYQKILHSLYDEMALPEFYFFPRNQLENLVNDVPPEGDEPTCFGEYAADLVRRAEVSTRLITNAYNYEVWQCIKQLHHFISFGSQEEDPILYMRKTLQKCREPLAELWNQHLMCFRALYVLGIYFQEPQESSNENNQKAAQLNPFIYEPFLDMVGVLHAPQTFEEFVDLGTLQKNPDLQDISDTITRGSMEFIESAEMFYLLDDLVMPWEKIALFKKMTFRAKDNALKVMSGILFDCLKNDSSDLTLVETFKAFRKDCLSWIQFVKKMKGSILFVDFNSVEIPIAIRFYYWACAYHNTNGTTHFEFDISGRKLTNMKVQEGFFSQKKGLSDRLVLPQAFQNNTFILYPKTSDIPVTFKGGISDLNLGHEHNYDVMKIYGILSDNLAPAFGLK